MKRIELLFLVIIGLAGAIALLSQRTENHEKGHLTLSLAPIEAWIKGHTSSSRSLIEPPGWSPANKPPHDVTNGADLTPDDLYRVVCIQGEGYEVTAVDIAQHTGSLIALYNEKGQHQTCRGAPTP